MDTFIPAATRSALLALSTLQRQIGEVQNRLSTGKRVNSPIDDPAAYFLAASLSTKANSINNLVEGITKAQSAVTAATNGIAAVKSLLTSAQTVANQALQSPQSLVTITSGNSSQFTTSSVIATISGSSSRFKTGDTLTVSDGTTTATYTAANNDTVQTLLNAINNNSNIKVVASLNAAGQIQIAGTSNVNITISSTTSGTGTLSSVLSLNAGTTNYTNNTLRSGLAAQFNTLLSQINQAAADAGYNGVNLLTGSSSTVVLNDSGTSTLTIGGSNASASGLGLSSASNNFQLDSDINTALSNISSAMSSLQAIATTIGSMSAVMQSRLDFNNAMVDLLRSGADTLTSSNSNEDSATLLALQTRQQLAATSISLSRGNETTALRLLGLG